MFNSVAIVVLVFRLTHSGLQVGATVAVEIAPVLLFGLAGGTLVDRVSRRRVMVSADLARVVVAALLAALSGHLVAVYAGAFLLSTFTVPFGPAAASALPALVEREQLVAANSALWSASVLSQIAVAPLAGALVAVAGAGPAFLLNALSFLASAALLAGLRLPEAVRSNRRRARTEIAEGLRAVRSSPFLARLAMVQGAAALSAGATSALLVVLAERRLHAGPGRFGILLAAIGIGAGCGPLLLQRFLRDPRRPVLLFGPYVLRGVVDLVLATFANFAVALGALVFYGVGTSTGMITFNSVLQTSVPERLRGRVFAFYDVVWQSARLVSIGLGGVLADSVGVRAVYLLGGLTLVTAGALGLTFVGAAPETPTGR